jgi:hypothetical protein
MVGSDTTPMIDRRSRDMSPDDGDQRLRRSTPQMRRRARRVGERDTRRAMFDAVYGDATDYRSEAYESFSDR